jgi:hypothetical protein
MVGITGWGRGPFQPSTCWQSFGLEGAVSMMIQEEFMGVQMLRAAGWTIQRIAEHVAYHPAGTLATILRTVLPVMALTDGTSGSGCR